MLKRGIVFGLLCIAGHAYSADITVTTTEDVDTSECSLRHAIQYVNLGKPESGYMGCGGKDSSSTIILKGNTTYKLKSQVYIMKDVRIQSLYENTSLSTSPVLGRNNAIIQMTGKDRLFYIDRKTKDPTIPASVWDKIEIDKESASGATDGSSDTDSIRTIDFYEVSLQGCGQDNCASAKQNDVNYASGKGGIIYNKEIIRIQYSRLEKGFAQQGGAIYNAGLYAENKPLSWVAFVNSVALNNQASQGAVIYSDIPQFLISQSVIRDNVVKDSSSAIFDIKESFDEERSKNLVNESLRRGILNSTIFNNTGHIAKILDVMRVNNTTMLKNTAGLIINAPYKLAYISNSILAQNGKADCEFIAGNVADNISNNLYSVGCAGTQSTALGNTTLIAGKDIEGECDLNSDGILCPFKTNESTSLGYFKPRLLDSYTHLSDSPIVNRGPAINSKMATCESYDQRGRTRIDTSTSCDRGAIELVVDTSSSALIGQDIFYGQTAKMTVADQLGDGTLLPAEKCQALLGNNLTGKPWQAGCMRVVQDPSVPVSKGTTTISPDGSVTYVPNGNWHGSDEFHILVISTTKRFNDEETPYLSIPVHIVQAPPNTFENKSVKTSGGSIGVGVLIILVGLLGLRRSKAKG